MELLTFVNSFKYNKAGSIDTESAKLTLYQLTNLDILESELVEYRSELNSELEEMEIDLPKTLVEEYYGSCLWDVVPSPEYQEKLDVVSKINEILSVISLCVTL